MNSVFKVSLASVLFGVVHSALASMAAKQLATRLFGERTANGLYRLFFGLQSLILLNIYNYYVFHLPDRPFYSISGLAGRLIRAAWLANGAFIGLYLLHAGVVRMLGLNDLAALVTGEPVVPRVEAQGPAPTSEGKLSIAGMFTWTRHPINFMGLPALWLRPTMTVNRLVSCIWLTIYLIIGSMREESRRRSVYGQAYEEYRWSGVPFMVPIPPRLRAWRRRRNIG
jgi:protein-S-isoprenylcysteine O-methyltransferase Ste14